MKTIFEVYFNSPVGDACLGMYDNLQAAEEARDFWNLSHGKSDQAKIATHKVNSIYKSNGGKK